MRPEIAVSVPHLNVRGEFPTAEAGSWAYEAALHPDLAYVSVTAVVLWLRGQSAGAHRETALR